MTATPGGCSGCPGGDQASDAGSIGLGWVSFVANIEFSLVSIGRESNCSYLRSLTRLPDRLKLTVGWSKELSATTVEASPGLIRLVITSVLTWQCGSSATTPLKAFGAVCWPSGFSMRKLPVF